MYSFLLIGAIVLALFIASRYVAAQSQVKVRVQAQAQAIAKQQKQQKQLKQSTQQPPNRAQQVLSLFKLSKLYLDGLPERYLPDGRKLAGIVPNPAKAIDLLTEAAQLGSEYAVLELAKIYQNGAHGFEPKPNISRQLYQRVLSISQNQRLTSQARLGLEQLTREQSGVPQRPFWDDKPHFWGSNPKQGGAGAPKAPPFWISNPKQSGTGATSNTIITIDKVFRVPASATQVASVDLDLASNDDPNAIKNDMHNVHDHAVIATIKQSFDRLKASTQTPLNKRQCCQELRNYIMKHSQNNQRTDALKALDAVERNVIQHSGMGATESDALKLIWNRINSKFGQDPEQVESLRGNLVSGLSEMVEHGKVCCVTGRFSRILDSLNVIDDEVTIKPTFAINQEMMNKAGQITERLVTQASESDRKTYEEGDNAELEAKIKESIKSELRKDYVDSGILTEQGFNTEVNKWIDHI